MQTAMLTGLVGINKPLEPICPTSNCDYPDLSTLGICSLCDDVTEKATQTCLPISSNSTLRVSSILGDLGGDDRHFASAHASCSYSSPSGLILDAPLFDTVTYGKELLQMVPQSFTSIARSNNHTISSVFMATYDSPLLYTPENLTAPEKRPKMTECSLYPCERLYTQNHVSTKSRALQVSKSQAMVNASISNNWIHLIPKNRVTFLPNSNYSIHWKTWDLLRKATSIFNTTLDQQPLEKEPGIRLGPIMYNSDNITESFAQMATSMTDNMRSGKGTIHVPGRAFLTETYIHVRWLWIMLPVTLIVLSILHLTVMAVMSRGQPVLWKSSILPVIMGRLETTPEHEIAHLRHMGEVQSISKNIKTVVRQEDRLVFSEED
ncbi:hypothetical protein ASPWEDRAFT_71908 [Aspergillus wentii DTO 134E9]|uniref:Uncharacterized protein n=1 Tax=Aspergillus wentii DTO 134E9 TaxID=1073089 RepID=A0A1L9R7F7_ASPWE|nr:uncharacterized protein ASPWEDRAFT_71908 [Aspergillus wentii DTO 134E9]KAI9927475.1 hypothetical protein MW887_003089 [Aspergillus wentii]OJJ30850.1 hypothetical protein ASPWEDRAFT_71908 [Aspergillus wentii DTO 134E9]